MRICSFTVMQRVVREIRRHPPVNVRMVVVRLVAAQRLASARGIEPQLLASLQRSGCRRQPEGELSARLNPSDDAVIIFPRPSLLFSGPRFCSQRLRSRGSIPDLFQDRV